MKLSVLLEHPVVQDVFTKCTAHKTIVCIIQIVFVTFAHYWMLDVFTDRCFAGDDEKTGKELHSLNMCKPTYFNYLSSIRTLQCSGLTMTTVEKLWAPKADPGYWQGATQ